MKNISTFTCKKKKSQEYIRHEFPEDGQYHPFDIESNDNYFVFAYGYTYLLKEENLSHKDILKTIPKSYRPYEIYERCFMIYRGEIVWKNKDIKNEPYSVLTLNKVQNDRNEFNNKIENITNNIEVDIQNIKELSKQNDNIYMIAKLIQNE